jgi:hypothetical protein
LSKRRLEQLTWTLIYGGAIAFSLGWFAVPRHGPWGELLISGGVVAAAAGALLIYVRSRLDG